MDPITRLGLAGVGRMGLGMSQRWQQHDIEVIRYDINPEVSDVASLEELVNSMPAGERVIWLMLPWSVYEVTLDQLHELLTEGDMIIDGGNSNWRDDMLRHARFGQLGVRYVDIGTSGGVYGLENGYAVMAGCSNDEFEALRPVLAALAPEENGLVHAGGSGMGHFTKEVHNAIEYGFMAALAEGYALMLAHGHVDDPAAVLASWRNGSIVSSFLLDIAVKGLNSEGFSEIAPVALDSGEGSWAVVDATYLRVPIPVISAALTSRFASQGMGDVAAKVVAAMRHEFGGHPVVPQATSQSEPSTPH